MTSEHIVKSFDDQLKRLENLIAEMGGLAEVQLADAIEAMSRRDLELAARVTAGDAAHRRSGSAGRSGGGRRMLALRQPMAKDLREIVGALKIASMLERIGDYAKNVAKRTAALVEMPPVPSAQTVGPAGQPGPGDDQGRARRLHRPRRRQGRTGPPARHASSTRSTPASSANC